MAQSPQPMKIVVSFLCPHGRTDEHFVVDNVRPLSWSPNICKLGKSIEIPPDVYETFAVSDLYRGNPETLGGNLAVKPRSLFEKYGN